MTLLRYKYELQLGGSWVDITTYVRHQKVTVKRGTTDESPKLTPATAALTLLNNDDRFNPRNPTGPYYGQLVRNTPIRISAILHPTVKGLWTPPSLAGGATTPDSAALSITGDLDLRAESPVYSTDYYYVTKSGSYALRSVGGFLQLQWYRTGVGEPHTRTSTAAIPAGHTAFRATLDVDNGASGHTVVFYTAANWGDPWVQLGASVVTAGTTAIDNTTGLAFLGGTTTDTGPLCVRRAEIRSGINGTVVASPNPAAEADGTTSFADAQGNTWTVDTDSRIGSGVPWSRFYGEVYSFAPRWNENRSDCTVPIEAYGALRRLIGGDVQPRSYYRSWMNTHTGSPTPKYFWPLEEGGSAASATPEIGQGDAWFKTTPADGEAWGKAKMNDWLPNGVAISNLNELHFPCDMRGSTANAWEVTMLLTFSQDTALCTGTVDCGPVQYLWAMGTDTVSDPNNPHGTLSVYTDAPEGLTLQTSSFTLPALKDCGPIWFTLRSWFSGSTITTYMSFDQVGLQSNTIDITTASTRSSPSMLYPREVAVACAIDLVNTNAPGYVGLSALSVSESVTGTVLMDRSYTNTKGAPSEATYDRLTRMLDEAGINNTADTGGAVLMGKQYVQGLEKHLLEILSSSRHSAIVESRDANELKLLGTGTYRGEIDYTDITGDLEPAEDDKNTANILRVNNSHGESATLTKATGEMSVAEIGPFEGKLDTNARKMQHAVSLAGARLALGTWPGPRFTEITVSARARPELYDLLCSIDIGDFFGVTGLSVAGYYDTLIMKVLHVKEEISQPDHRFTFTVRPGEIDYRLWTVGTNRVDLADSTVAVGGSGSTIDVNVPTAKWSTTAVPYDVMASGEQMTVTAVSNLTSTTQRLAVTRAVNGVVKSTPVGAEVHPFPGFYIKAV